MIDEKQIDEMAKDITEIEFPENHPNVAVANEFEALIEAKALYEKGYRKIPENAVVIPEKITEETSPEDIIKIAKYNETIRKETAREVIAKIIWYAVKHIKGQNKDECFIEISFEKIDEIAKQYGVEVEE